MFTHRTCGSRWPNRSSNAPSVARRSAGRDSQRVWKWSPSTPFRQPGQVGSRNTEPRIGRRRIIEVGRHRRIGRVHPQPAGYAVQQGPGAEALPLSQRIERNVVAATHYLRKIVFGIDRRIGMRPAAILFEHEARFRHGTRRSPVGMFPQQRGICATSHTPSAPRLFLHPQPDAPCR